MASSSSSTPPAASAEGAQRGYIGKTLLIEGSITGSTDLVVDGRVKGSISLDSNSLTVGPDGQVDAEVEARDIKIQGKVSGNVSARDRVEIAKTGSVEGEVTTARIAVEDGAVFRGSVNIANAQETGAKTVPPSRSV